MEKTKIFKSGNSFAVRLPKNYRLEEDEVFISKVGDAILLMPVKKGWTSMFNSLSKFSDDYLVKRKQPVLDARERF